MKRSLLRKFIGAYVLLAIACFTLVSTVGSTLVQNRLIKTTSKSLYYEASHIASSAEDVSFYDQASLKNTYSSFQSLGYYQKAEIWYLSTNGNILINSSKGIDVEDPEIIPGFNPTAFHSGYYLVGNFFDYFDENMLSVIYPVTSGMHVKGYIALHTTLNTIIEQRESILKVIHLLFLIAFLLFSLIPFMIYKLILYPLYDIEIGIEEYAKGNLDYQVSIESNDEIGHLGSQLNFMATTLASSEESQKKFISNVSHDFRSPLTSIKGYIEAIQDGTIPPEFQDRYLNIILQETKRLEKLTADLLTLNKLDSKGNYVALSDFDINTVIRDTVASFGGKCIHRHISFDLLLDGTELYVNADYSKIQQVLSNLIDNAIKFSKDNSKIEVETELRRDKIYISVKDHGCGIPRESIPKIWDRFYKSDSSRGKDTSGTGLGLAIVRDIINQHHQTITVVSTENVGTEFKFSLAKGKKNNS